MDPLLEQRLIETLVAKTNSTPQDSYMISDSDSSGTTQYFGNIKQGGSWYILQVNTISGTYRYSSGTANYNTATIGAWAIRTTLEYRYAHETDFR